MAIWILVIISLIAVVVGFFLFNKKSRHLRVPPGPKGYPFIGNVADFSSCDPYVALTRLSKKYGDIYQMTLIGGQKAVIVNTATLAREALLSKKDDFSGRPYTFIGDYLTRGTMDILCADFTPTMVSLRKIVHSALKIYGQGMQRLEGHICSEADDLAKRLVEHNGTPFDPKADICVTVLNVICAIVYGQSYQKHEEEFQKIVEYNDIISSLFSSFNVLDLFPFLKHFPLPSVKALNKARRIRDEIINKKFKEHKENFLVENACNNFEIKDLTDALLKAFNDNVNEDKKGPTLTEDNIMMTMNDVFNAGFETTESLLRWIVLYMVHYPEVQKRLQKELDTVIGHGRLPTLKDRENLPYTRAVIAETLRITSLTPLALPHKATRDTTLAGYDIPKGHVLILNQYAIHHNPSEWENPNMFVPERFLEDDGNFNSSNKNYLPFSAGRRHCIGESLAKSEVFLLTSRLLHQFSLTNPPGEALPSFKGTQGVVIQPQPFQVIAKERV